jgi:hypothetical protein
MKIIIIITIASALLASLISTYLFYGNLLFLFFPFLTGLFIIFFQPYDKTYKFLNNILLNSLLFSFFTIFFIRLREYLFYDLYPGYSFGEYFTKTGILSLFPVFFFVSFVGGLVGVTIKGFFKLKIK